MAQITPEMLAKAGTEHAHQMAFFCWAAQNYDKWPCLRYMNGDAGGMSASSKVAAAKAKAAGNKKGFPDIFLPYPTFGYCGLFIELKRPKSEKYSKGVIDPEQQKYMMYLNSVGYHAVPCYGYLEAVEVTQQYLLGAIK